MVDLLRETPFKRKFLTGDGTEWKVRTRWRFNTDENSSKELTSNLPHVIFIQQMNNFEISYEKTVEAYPLEVSNYITIERTFRGSSFSITLREYTDAFRPTQNESFHMLGFKLNLTPVPIDPISEHAISSQDCEYSRFPCLHKRYDYESMLNMSQVDVITSAADTALRTIITAMQDDNENLKTETTDYIAKNFSKFQNTEVWTNFARNHPDLYVQILSLVIEYMGEESTRASQVLSRTISKWDINTDA